VLVPKFVVLVEIGRLAMFSVDHLFQLTIRIQFEDMLKRRHKVQGWHAKLTNGTRRGQSLTGLVQDHMERSQALNRD